LTLSFNGSLVREHFLALQRQYANSTTSPEAVITAQRYLAFAKGHVTASAIAKDRQWLLHSQDAFG
jgi:hypothetical protein